MTTSRTLVFLAPLVSLLLTDCMVSPANGDAVCGSEGSTIEPWGYFDEASVQVNVEAAPSMNGPWTMIGQATSSPYSLPISDKNGTTENYFPWNAGTIRLTASLFGTEGSGLATYVRSYAPAANATGGRYYLYSYDNAATSPTHQDWYDCTDAKWVAQGQVEWYQATQQCQNATAPIVRISAPQASTCAVCPMETTCPPGMYNTTASGFDGTYTTSNPVLPTGCSYTPPALSSCATQGNGPAPVYNPPFVAPVLSSVAIGGNTVYAIGTPAVSLGGADARSAVYAWGDNSGYQLGNGTTTSSTIPQVPLFTQSVPIKQIVAGDQDACALLGDGTVKCWGTISAAFAPQPTAKQIAIPAGVTIKSITHGDHHACAVAVDGTLYCWGNSEHGQLGKTSYSSATNPSDFSGYRSYNGRPLVVTPDSGFNSGVAQAPGAVLDAVASGNSTCIRAEGSIDPTQISVYCWGDDAMGSLGDNHGGAFSATDQAVYVSIEVPDKFGGSDPAGIALLTGSNTGAEGQYGSFCAKTAGTLGTWASWYCWGADDHGQLDIFPVPTPNAAGQTQGVNAPTPPTELDGANPPNNNSPVVNADTISLGGNHGCAQLSGVSFCFGNNDDGQIGAANMGSNTAIRATELVPKYSAIAVGTNMTCGISADGHGTVSCWGINYGTLMSDPTPTPLPW